MKKVLAVLLIAALTCSMYACGSEKEGQKDPVKTMSEGSVSSGEMPAFSTVDLNGNTVTNDVFSQADITVVNFWATFCGPCINEMPELAEWNASMPDNVQIIGIVVDVESEAAAEYADAQMIIEQAGADYPNLLPTMEMNEILDQIVGVPTTYFVDRNGLIIGEPIVGAYVSDYQKVVEEYLNGQQ